MVSPNSTKDHKGNRNREVYYSQVLEEVHGMPAGAIWENVACLEEPYKGKQSGRNLGHMLLLLGSMAGVLLGSWAKA